MAVCPILIHFSHDAEAVLTQVLIGRLENPKYVELSSEMCDLSITYEYTDNLPAFSTNHLESSAPSSASAIGC